MTTTARAARLGSRGEREKMVRRGLEKCGIFQFQIGNWDLIGSLRYFTVPTCDVWVLYPLLPDLVGLPHVLVHAVHLVFLVWMGRGVTLRLFYY